MRSRSRSRSPRHRSPSPLRSPDRRVLSRLTSCVKIVGLSGFDTQERLFEATKPFKAVGCRVFQGPSRGIEEDGVGYIDFSTTRDSSRFVETDESGRFGVFEWEGKEFTLDYAENAQASVQLNSIHQNNASGKSVSHGGHASNALDFLASGVPLDQLDATIPDRVLVLQNLGFYATNESILSALGSYGKILNIRLLRDPITQIFAGACFIETENAMAAQMIIDAVKRNGYYIDGNLVSLQIAREVPHIRPSNSIQSKMDSQSLKQIREQAQMYATNTLQLLGRDDIIEKDKQKRARKEELEMREERAAYEAQRYRDEQKAKQAAKLVQDEQIKLILNAGIAGVTPVITTTQYPAYQDQSYFAAYNNYNGMQSQTPNYSDPSYYYFDSASGYYVYPALQLYYHPSTQLFYAWDAGRNEYVIKPSPFATSAPQDAPQEKKKSGPIKFAIKASSPSTSKPVSAPVSVVHVEAPIVSETDVAAPSSVEMKPDVVENVSSDGHVNYDRLQCLLCSRGFASREKLDLHVLQSELHKKNLEIEKLRLVTVQHSQTVVSTLRRERIVDAEELAVKSETKVNVQPSAPPLLTPKPDNIGSLMMKNMGWHDGAGLGKNLFGDIQPLKPIVYAKNAGIGTSPKGMMLNKLTRYVRKSSLKLLVITQVKLTQKL